MQSDILIDTLALDYLGFNSPSRVRMQAIFEECARDLREEVRGDRNYPERSFAACGGVWMSKIYRQSEHAGLMIGIAGNDAQRLSYIVDEQLPHIRLSRIDLQVTTPMIHGQHIDDLYHVLSNPEQYPWKQRGRAPECTIISNTSGGKTLYIGKRVSDLMTRVYYKPIEGVRHLRWEVEIKGRMAKALAEQGVVGDRDKQATAARAILAGYPDGVRQYLLPIEEAIGQGTGEIYREPRSNRDEETLQWWTGTVIPALKNACRGRLRRQVLGAFQMNGFDVSHISGYDDVRRLLAGDFEE